MSSIHYLVWLFFSAIFFAGGELFSKKFALQPRWTYFFLLLFFYFLGILAWLPALFLKNQLSVVGALWSVISLLATVLIGLVIFEERLNMFGIIGLVFAFLAIFLLSLE